MYCPKCGNKLSENDAFCSDCGYQINQNNAQFNNSGANQAANFNQNYNNGQLYQQRIYQPSMKWYKFIIYFQLFAMAVISVLNGVYQICYGILSFTDTQSPYLFVIYDPILASSAISGGIILIALAVFEIIIRMELAKFQSGSPALYLVIYSISVCVTSVLNIIQYCVLSSNVVLAGNNTSEITNSIIMIISLAVYLPLNITYFKKRAYMFRN